MEQLRNDIDAALVLANTELNERRAGIIGDSTENQLQNHVIPELTHLLALMDKGDLKKNNPGYLLSFGNALRVWGWSIAQPTPLFDKLNEIHFGLEDLHRTSISGTAVNKVQASEQRTKPGLTFLILQCIAVGLIIITKIAIIVANDTGATLLSILILPACYLMAIITWIVGAIRLIRARAKGENLLYLMIANILPLTLFLINPLLDFARTKYIPHEREWLGIVEEIHSGERERHGYEPYSYRAGGEVGHEDVYFSINKSLVAGNNYYGFVYSEDDVCNVSMTDAGLIEWTHVRGNWYYAYFRY